MKRARPDSGHEHVSVELSAVVVAVTGDEPRVLALRQAGGLPDALPSGPLEPQHRTLEAGLRAWVEEHTRQTLGYVEQLYTFGDQNRQSSIEADAKGVRPLSVGYVALVREARPEGSSEATWRSWYDFFPWEDWRDGPPAILDQLISPLQGWARSAAKGQREVREERIKVAFGLDDAGWNEERVLERYELLYEVGLVPEVYRDKSSIKSAPKSITAGAMPMAADHRRILATAIGRLRGKIKYRPVVFELMPPAFTLLHLQRTVEALSGQRLHKPNFRRLVESQGLVEETGEVTVETGGRPARLVRFRRDVLLERPAPGVRLNLGRRSA